MTSTAAPGSAASIIPRISARSAAIASGLATAAQHHQAAEGEAGDRRTGDQLRAVLVGLTTPVGELGDAAAQDLDRAAQVTTLQIDVAADLRRGAARFTGGGGTNGMGLRAHSLPAFAPDSSVSRVSFASAIACSGPGGAPACTER